MVELAIADRPYFKLATLEIERAGPTYTIDTIMELRKQLDSKDQLFFILGWDSVNRLHEWREADKLIQLCYLVAAPRPGYSRPDLKALEAHLPGASQRVMLMDEPHLDISATEIRERVAKGLSVRHLVPEPVNEYIKKQKLYLDQ
jgi:nicotinate-nucleotide adenylyltransferase